MCWSSRGARAETVGEIRPREVRKPPVSCVAQKLPGRVAGSVTRLCAAAAAHGPFLHFSEFPGASQGRWEHGEGTCASLHGELASSSQLLLKSGM